KTIRYVISRTSCSLTASRKAARRAATLRAHGLTGAKRPLDSRASAGGGSAADGGRVRMEGGPRERQTRPRAGSAPDGICTNIYYRKLPFQASVIPARRRVDRRTGTYRFPRVVRSSTMCRRGLDMFPALGQDVSGARICLRRRSANQSG